MIQKESPDMVREQKHLSQERSESLPSGRRRE
jgi:hypothetical protein